MTLECPFRNCPSPEHVGQTSGNQCHPETSVAGNVERRDNLQKPPEYSFSARDEFVLDAVGVCSSLTILRTVLE